MIQWQLHGDDLPALYLVPGQKVLELWFPTDGLMSSPLCLSLIDKVHPSLSVSQMVGRQIRSAGTGAT